MAISDQQKLFIVQKMGYDPEKYTTDDDGNNVIRKSFGQPSITPTPIIQQPEQLPTTPQHSATGAFGLNLAQNIPGAVGGGAAAGLASVALPTILGALGLGETSTGVGALIGIPTMAAAAYFGSKAANKLTEAVEPNSMLQNVQQSAQEHPTAAFLGNLASIPAGGLNPSIPGLMKPGYGAASGLSKLLMGLERTPAESANLMNVAAGAGLGAGQNALESFSQNGSVDPKSMLESGLIGALFNKPNPLGTGVYGFHGVPKDISEQLQGTTVSQPQQSAQQVKTTPQVDPDVLALQQAQNRAQVLRNIAAPSGMEVGVNYSIDPKTGEIKIPKKNSETVIPQTSAAESALHMDSLLRANAPVEQRSAQNEDTIKQTQLADMQRQQAEQELQQQLKARAEITRQKAAELQSQNAADAMDLKSGMGPKFPNTTPKPLATTELGHDIMPDYTGNMEHDNSVNADESDLELRRLEGNQDKYQTGANPSTQFEQETLQKAKDQNAPVRPTQRWFEIFKNWIENVKGIKTDINGEPIDDKGNPVSGQALMQEGIPQLIRARLKGNNLAGSDTLPHEVDHALMSVMENSKRPRDQKFMQRYYDIIKESPQYQEWAKNTTGDNSPNEYAAQNGGYEFLRRHLNLDNESSFKKWLGDVRSYWKTRFTDHADESDFRRMLNYKMMYGDKLGGEVPTSVSNVTMKNQDESHTSDRAQYDAVNSKLISLMREGKHTSPEFQATWKQMEDIKNRHGGMPPAIQIKNSSHSNTANEAVTPDIYSKKEKQKGSALADKIYAQAMPAYERVLNNTTIALLKKTGQPINLGDAETYLIHNQSKLKHILGDLDANRLIDDYQKSLIPFNKAKELESLNWLSPNTRNQEKSNTAGDEMLSPDNDIVKESFGHAIKEGYDDPDVAERLHSTLRDDVDWSEYPAVKQYLDHNDFDSGDRKWWLKAFELYGARKKELGTKPSSLANALAGVNVDEKGNITQTPQEVKETNEAKAKEALAQEIHEPIAKEETKVLPLEAVQQHKAKLLEELKSLTPESPESNAKRQEINNALDLEDKLKRQGQSSSDAVNPELKPTKETKKYPSDNNVYSETGDSTGAKFRRVQDRKTGDVLKQEMIEQPEYRRNAIPDSEKVSLQPLEQLTPEQQSSRLEQIKKEWDEVYNTKHPYDLAARMRGDYAKALDYSRELRAQGDIGRKYQTAVSRMQQLKMMYEELKAKHRLTKKTSAIDEGLETYNSKFSQLPFVRPQIEVAREKANKYGNDEGDKFADAYNAHAMDRDRIYGKGMYPILQAAKGLSPKEIAHVNAVGINEFRDKQDYSGQLNQKELELHQAIRQSLEQKQLDQIAAGQPVTGHNGVKRLPQIDKYYWPNRLDKNFHEVLSNPSKKAQLDSMRQDFITHNVNHGISQPAAEDKWNSIIKANTGELNLTRFRANREAEGVGLPDSMLDRGNLLKNMSAYYTRVSADRAFHDNFESDPDNAKLIGLDKDAWGNNQAPSNNEHIGNIDEVKSAMDKIYGEGYDHSERTTKALARTATSLMLGPLTNIHIAASSLANSLQYTNPSYTAQAFLHGITHMSEGLQNALKTGYARKDFGTIKDLFTANSNTIDRLGAIANTASKLGGREAANNLTKGYLQAFGEYVVKQKHIEASTGNKEATNLMTHIDPEWSANKQYSPEELQQVSSNFASLIHGAHDGRTLPNWMLKDTAIQPFFQLASWNIAQTNQWMRHVWTPAKQGNFVPLIMSTLGAGIGGYVIKELRERISDRKSAIPSLSEIVNSSQGIEGNKNNLAYNLMAMSSYVGYAGILSTLGKVGEDLAHKNIPQSATFPLDELVGNSAQRISQYVSAMINDPNMDYVSAGTKLVTDLAKENVQLARLGISWAANSSDLMPQEAASKALNQKTQDYRRYEMVEGMPYEPQTVNTANPYLNSKLKKFKRTQDIGEAAEVLPSLIDNAFKKANGNPDVLKNELQKIKQNTYETMPNPDRMPLTFIRYLTYLSQKEGSEEATNRLTDYFQHNAINKAKESLVPSLGN